MEKKSQTAGFIVEVCQSRRCPTLAVPVPGRWTIHDSRVSITAVPSERWHVGPIGPSKPPTRALAFAHQSVTFPCACI
jgi:hypothetical protein